ncbi:hypothetical protein GH714_031263 [Hevea brasiliensis]|uniref:SART-1 family protein n=1 Tax=Hevea brasiliensis TaxID=3981 RepID=A0A6A6LNI1_HEVBR|nr:hypothetical protein GH714_031263 [Hevea brasiliensis]
MISLVSIQVFLDVVEILWLNRIAAMDMDWSESRYKRHKEKDGVDDEDGTAKSSKHSGRDKDRRKSSRVEDRDTDHRNKDRERTKRTTDDIAKDVEKEQDDYVDKERGKDRSRDSKAKDKDHDRDKSREKDRERDKDRKDRGKEKSRDRERERERERVKEKDREKYKDREKEREIDKDRDREKARDKAKEREREADHDKERLREKDKLSRRSHGEDYDRSKDDVVEMSYENDKDRDVLKQANASFDDDHEQKVEGISGGGYASALELEGRILKMKEERLKKNSEVGNEDNIVQGESEDEEGTEHATHDLAGVKVLHGIEKVMEGGAVVLTLKDQSILADGSINEEVDMLENVEIGEQKRRDEAYKAAKKKTGIYDDKFNDDPASEKKILPQYDDSTTDEGVTLDERGRFTGEAEKKLEELRRRLQGSSTNNRFEDLNASGKISSDYYTQEEMLQFKKPKKKKSLRKKEKLDINALEAEAVSAGLGVGDLGSRSDGRRQAIREEQERSEAEMRSNAYQSAYAKADEASKSLRLEQTLTAKVDEDENPVFADDDEDLYKSLERARKLALKKQEEASGPQAIARLAVNTTTSSHVADDNLTTAESQENKIVFTEMEEFVWGLQLDEEAHKPDSDDVFMDEDEAPPRTSEQERKDEAGGWTEVKDTDNDENPVNENQEDIVPDATIHEVPVGKGLSGALNLLKERGTLKESIEWGGRNMDKKKSKLVGIVDNNVDNDKFKDIRIERTDEFGRIITPKEAFRMISHKFHGKGPGKMKQEKRMKQYQEELKLKQMKNSDTPSLSVERMREAQAQLKTPYLVLSGHVKPGQTSDPRSGFATVEKDLPGGLTPMLGDKKRLEEWVERCFGLNQGINETTIATS